jgi:hypothetical protein
MEVDGPQQGAENVQQEKFSGGHPAQTDDTGGHGPDPVAKPESENQEGLVAVEKTAHLFDPACPRRSFLQQPVRMPPPQKKIELVPAKGAGQRGPNDQGEVQLTPVGRDAGPHQDGFPLQKSADKDRRISAMDDEGIDGHPFSRFRNDTSFKVALAMGQILTRMAVPHKIFVVFALPQRRCRHERAIVPRWFPQHANRPW